MRKLPGRRREPLCPERLDRCHRRAIYRHTRCVLSGSPGSQMEHEILEQPRALYEANIRLPEVMQGLPNQGYRQVVLVARGSSDNAALYLRYLVEVFLGIPAILAAPSVATVYGRQVAYENALGVAISQSGQSPDVRAVIALLRKQGHTTVAITNSADSPLAQEAEYSVDLGVGQETSIAATKTYSASLLAGYHLARALGAQLPEAILPDEAWMHFARTCAESAVGLVIEANALFALGRGFSFASAEETALKLTECALIPCKSYSTADFAHGPKAISGPDAAAVVFGDAPQVLLDTSCRVLQAPDAGSQPDAPIREIVFSQFLALHAAREKGIDPDAVPNLSKVTKTY